MFKCIEMEKIKTQAEDFKVLRAAQQKILNSAGTYVPFDFAITTNEKKEIKIDVSRGFNMRNIDSKTIAFIGKSLEEATQNFLDFFVNGGQVRISLDENGFQFYAVLAYEKNWSVSKMHVGHYYSREG